MNENKKHPMYYIIPVHMCIKKISFQDVADNLGISMMCLFAKINGEEDFTVNEAKTLSRILQKSQNEIFLTTNVSL